MNVDQDISLLRHLVELFYPLVELTLFTPEGMIAEIHNAFSTRKEDQACDVKSYPESSCFTELLPVGRTVRCLIHPLYSGQAIVGYVRLRYDLTPFQNLQEQLSILVQGKGAPAGIRSTEFWQEAIDQIIHSFLDEKKINLQALSTKHKRELISRVREKGLFDFKESSAYVAAKLQMSRATVYNYLKIASDLKKVRIHQVDAFTSQKFGGNPAGVVLEADALDEQIMRKIARELNLSETAFVLSSDSADFQLRYFTPTGHEIAFCGHSTVGALYMIAKEKRFAVQTPGHYAFHVQTLCGVLKMEVMVEEDEEIQVAYETPAIKLRPVELSHEEVAKAAGFDPGLADPTFPLMYEETNKDLFIAIRSLADLKKVECDAKSLAHFSKQHEMVALCAFTPAAFDQNNQFHMRCFAPLVGVPEDPFTGSVLGGLAAYVDQFKLVPKGTRSFCVEQGHFIERPGVVKVQSSKHRGVYQAKVFAHAVHCFSTEIHL